MNVKDGLDYLKFLKPFKITVQMAKKQSDITSNIWLISILFY